MLQLGYQYLQMVGGRLLLREIAANTPDVLDRAAGTHQGKGLVAYPSNLPIDRPPDAEFLGHPVTGADAPESVEHPCPVLGLDQFCPALEIATPDYLLQRRTIHLAECRADEVELQRARIPDPQDVGRGRGKLAESLLAGVQRLLRLRA